MSDMTKILLGLGAGALLLGGGWFYYSQAPAEPEETGGFSQAETEEFTARMRAETTARVGQPIEGFEPFMFMQAFPGLIASDFADVDALIGLYRYENGEVVYDLNGEVEAHSAARAISDEGMEQLLANISSRITFMQGADMLEQLFLAISPDSSGQGAAGGTELAAGERVSLDGTIVCLPHKGDGPHTMECAFGFMTPDGTHYGLQGANPPLTDTEVDVSVVGTFQPAPANEKYDIVGYIEVESINTLVGS